MHILAWTDCVRPSAGEAFIYRHEYGRLVLTKYIYTHVYNIFLGSGYNMPLWDFVGNTLVTHNYHD